MICYSIKDWAIRFENNRSRELKSLDWFPCPNKLDGDGYTELIEREHGPASYGCFIAMCAVASRCSPRGKLVRDSRTPMRSGIRPHDSASISRLTRIKTATIDQAIKDLVLVGWLIPEVVDAQEDMEIPHGDAGFSHDDAVLSRKGMEGKEGNELKEENTRAALACTEPEIPASVLPGILSFPVVGRGSKIWILREDYLTELSSAFPDLDALAESRKALAWINASPGRRKTDRGMKRFLVGWLGRAQNQGGRGHSNGNGNIAQPRADELDPADAAMIEERARDRERSRA